MSSSGFDVQHAYVEYVEGRVGCLDLTVIK